MRRTKEIWILGLLVALTRISFAQDHAPAVVEPSFLPLSNPYPNPQFYDYRPVLNTSATTVIFERTYFPTSYPNRNITTLYSADPATGNAASLLPDFKGESTRPDWCWQRSKGSLTSGLLAFAGGDGIYLVAGDGKSLVRLPNTMSMTYPSWYPDCQHIAVDVFGQQVTAEIDTNGNTIVPVLANDKVWAGFPSVNQANSNLIAFAGQEIRDNNYYNENLNYVWVTDRSKKQPKVAPLDREIPNSPGFLQKFQGRAGWWSPDGKWYAFESNRACSQIDGEIYTVFIQDAAGAKPPMQATDCNWNVQHPKWYPPGTMNGRATLIAATAPAENPTNFGIATFDVSAFVGRY
jgi:hypothetical protein